MSSLMVSTSDTPEGDQASIPSNTEQIHLEFLGETKVLKVARAKDTAQFLIKGIDQLSDMVHLKVSESGKELGNSKAKMQTLMGSGTDQQGLNTTFNNLREMKYYLSTPKIQKIPQFD